MKKECKNCLNNTANPTISINKYGLCRVCELYEKNFNQKTLDKELTTLKSFIGTGSGKYDALVGISGGKDSTATLQTIIDMGFTPLAFTLDIGYYPKSMISRAKKAATILGVDHEIIDIRPYISKQDRISYEKTAKLFDRKPSKKLAEEFFSLYIDGKNYYSVKSKGSHSFVRTCRLCRHTVIPAYYREARKYGVSVVVLGINEWAGLSQDKRSDKFVFSSIRKLQPTPNSESVFVVHLPFLLQRSIEETKEILEPLGWKIPEGEDLVESNSNSCLLARAAEAKASDLLGFHPDSTRLSREVTAGFITKKQCKDALNKAHKPKESVRQVLEEAGII